MGALYSLPLPVPTLLWYYHLDFHFFPLKPLQSLCASVSQGRNTDPLLRAGLRLIDLLVQHPEQSRAVEESSCNPPALGKSFPKGRCSRAACTRISMVFQLSIACWASTPCPGVGQWEFRVMNLQWDQSWGSTLCPRWHQHTELSPSEQV